MNMKNKQRGAVLVISMILLLVITLIGLSGLSTTGLEEKMAANFQFQNLVFQGAEEAVERGLDDYSFLSDVKRGVATSNPVTNTDPRVTSSVAAEYLGEATPTGDEAASIDAAASNTLAVWLNYELTGSAHIPNSNSDAVHVQGSYLTGLAPRTTDVHKKCSGGANCFNNTP